MVTRDVILDKLRQLGCPAAIIEEAANRASLPKLEQLLATYGPIAPKQQLASPSAAALQQAAVQLGFSQEDAATLCGVSKRTIWLSCSAIHGGRTAWEDRTQEERYLAETWINERAADLDILPKDIKKKLHQGVR